MQLLFLCHDSENKLLKELSFIALAVAAALKCTPALLGAILIFKGRSREALRLMLYGITAFFAPFLFFKGGFLNIDKFLLNMSLNVEMYKRISECSFYALGMKRLSGSSALWLKVSQTAAIVLGTVIIISIPLWEKSSRKLMFLILAMIMMPAHSGKYNIIYLFPALIVFLDEKERSPADILYFIFFVLMLSPLYTPLSEIITVSPFICAIYILAAVEAAAILIKQRKKLLPVYKDIFKGLIADLGKLPRPEISGKK